MIGNELGTDARRIDQLLPAAHVGDATGDAAVHLADILRAAGYRSKLYALTVDPPMRNIVEDFDHFPAPSERDLTLLHFALPSPLGEALAGYAGRRAIVYHNLTPPELLAPFCPEVAELTALGRQHLDTLAASGRVDMAIGVSGFNTAELAAAGFSHTTTLPLPMDLARYDAPADRLLAQRLRRAPRIFLTVGRIAPNKRLEDFFRAAAYYLRYIDADAWFIAVGGNRGMERYSDALMDLHHNLRLDDRVRLVGRASEKDLIAWYRAASVYVCTSEHEGFCAPLLEAMHFGLPVLARQAAAIPETLGNAGLTYADPEPTAIAEMLHLLATEAGLRQDLKHRAVSRLADFAPEAVGARWLSTLGDLVGRP